MTTGQLVNVSLQAIDNFGNKSFILEDINLCFSEKDRIGLIGRNGTGKSSLLSMIIGQVAPTKGNCRILPSRNEVTLMLQRPEDHFLFGTVGEQIHSYCQKNVNYSQIIELLNLVGLPEYCVKLPPLSLSSGQQRLVAIACAMGSNTHILLLDEPMAGLDSTGRSLVKKALLKIAGIRDFGWIIVSHHPDDLLGLVDWLWILESRHLVYNGPMADVPLEVVNNNFHQNGVRFLLFLKALKRMEYLFLRIFFPVLIKKLLLRNYRRKLYEITTSHSLLLTT